MRTNTLSVLCRFLLIYLIFYAKSLHADSGPNTMDPVQFTISTQATYLNINEEFEIKITARYLSLNPNIVYVFEGANSFKLKLIMPEGFKQTGGTYSDFVGTELTSSKPEISYTVKGKFISETSGGTFQLLRSHKNANNHSEFSQVGTLAFTVLSPTKDTLGNSNARIAVVNPEYIPYMTLTEFRAGAADLSKVIYINEGGKSGIFRLDPTNTTSVDDESMILVYGTKRYIREDIGYLRPEWFGAISDDTQDDYQAIQKALNTATSKGLTLKFSDGKYLVSAPLIPKINDFQYKLSLIGTGKGKTIIQGDTIYAGGESVFEFLSTATGDSTWADSFIEIKDMTILAGNASRVLNMNKVRNVKLTNLYLQGGELYTVEVGDSTGDNYAFYSRDCYLNALTSNGGHNTALLRLRSRYAEITGMVSDGSFYAMDITADQCYIAGNTLEGYKFAGIHFKSKGGGANKIIGNTLRPYAHWEYNGLFNGTMHGILIESDANGAEARNTISANQIFMPSPNDLDKVATVTNVNGIEPNSETNRIRAQTRNVSALVVGYNPGKGTMNFENMTGGSFIPGEQLKQDGTNGTATFGDSIPNHSYGITLLGITGNNSITGNAITGSAEWGIRSVSPNNIIIGNQIHGINGILLENDTQVNGNYIYTPGAISVKRNSGNIDWNDNVYNGSLSGIAPQPFSSVTTAQRDAVVSPKAGLILYDTSVNKHTKYNGTSWSYFDSGSTEDPRWISGTARVSNLNDAVNSGLKTWGTSSGNAPGGYGTIFTFVGASADGSGTAGQWVNQFLADTGEGLFFRQSINGNAWTTTRRLWTSQNIVAASVNSATAAAGSTPTKAEFDALLQELRTLKANMRNAGILEQ
jgi:hypothetical protein